MVEKDKAIMKFIQIGTVTLIALGLAGCNNQNPGSGQTSGAVIGALAGGLIGNGLGHGDSRAVNTVAGALIGGIIGGGIGAQLDEADRQAAYDAQYEAVDTGRRRSWRGPHGSYGYVDPGPEAYRAEGYCREYTQTIYIDGRPRAGHGLACREPDGSWKVVS